MRLNFRSALLSIALLAIALPLVGWGNGAAGDSSTVAMFAQFGGAVVVGDGEVLVGEAANQFRPGQVYLFRRSSGGDWTQAGILSGPDAAVGDRFGTSLVLDGNSLFVGAGAGADAVVHVYARAGSSWRMTGTVRPAMARDDSARFGTATAASGEWLMIAKAAAGGGGRGRGGGGGGGGGRGRGGAGAAAPQPPGAVYVFRRGTGGQYAYFSTIVSPDSANAGDNFGAAIAMNGNSALIGANGAAERAGMAFEFAFDSTGTWRSVAAFAPASIGAGESFGSAIALMDDQALVTASGDGGGYGAVYLFSKAVGGRGGRGGRAGGGGGGGRGGRGGGQGANANWQEVLRVVSPVGSRSDQFGAALAGDARDVFVGAPGARGTGGVFLFSGNVAGGVLTDPRFIAPPFAGGGVGAGRSIAINGDVAAISVPSYNAGAGSVMIYERDAMGQWREANMLASPVDEIAPMTGAERKCSNTRPDSAGTVGDFDCGNIELLAFLPPSRLSGDGHIADMNDIWGWTDPVTGKEWAIVGRVDGTAFVDISDPMNPRVAADLPMTPGSRANSWRDMKVYKDHAYIVADGAGAHGMQVFDLTRLREMNGPTAMVEPDTIYRQINSSHNIVINEESGFAYSVGSSAGGETCGGGLHMIDIREPKNPKFAGCAAHQGTGRSGTGYIHDAQCVTYKGPDRRYSGREICLSANERQISVVDVTDKQAPKYLSQADYPNPGYTHQGWFTEDHRYWFQDDESDEGPNVQKTRTLIWDLADLENPKLAKEHMGVEGSYDHNLYIKGNLMYQANYKSGLRILDVSNPENPKEVGFFDTAPYGPNNTGFQGAWSVYPFFQSGTVIVNSIEQGLFVLKFRGGIVF